MNERIEDLMYQSGLTAQGCWDQMDSYDRSAIEKFAKLLIKECAEVAEDYDGAHYVGTEIQKHFGVEE